MSISREKSARQERCRDAKSGDIFVNDSVPAEIDAIRGQHVFRKIVFNRFTRPEFPLARFFVGQQIGDLIIKNPIVFLRDKIDFPVFQLSDFYFVTPRRKFRL